MYYKILIEKFLDLLQHSITRKEVIRGFDELRRELEKDILHRNNELETKIRELHNRITALEIDSI